MDTLTVGASRVHWFTKIGLLCFAVVGVAHMIGSVRPLPSLAMFSFALYATHRYTSRLLRDNSSRPLNWTELLNNSTSSIQRFLQMAVDTFGSLSFMCFERTDNVTFQESSPGVTLLMMPIVTANCEEKLNDVPASNSTALAELDVLLQHVMRDFVTSWYHQLSVNEQFTREIQYAMEDLSVALVSRFRKLGSAGLKPQVRRLIRTFHKYFASYLRAVRRAEAVSRLQNDRVVDVPDFFEEWHYALAGSDNAVELRHLHNIVDLMLEVLVPADVLSCPISRRLLVSLIADSVLLPLVDLFSSQNWINRQLVYLLGDMTTESLLSDFDKASMCSMPRQSGDVNERLDIDENKDKLIKFTNHNDDGDGDVTSGLCCCGSLKSLNNCDLETFDVKNGSPAEFSTGAIEILGYEMNGTRTSPAESTDGIWRRMADKTPAAFRTERQHEVCEIVQEKKKTMKLPLSTSFDKLGDIFSNTIGELERPLEYITGNLAHYFRMTVDDGSNSISNNADDKTGIGFISTLSTNGPSPMREADADSGSTDTQQIDHQKVSSVLGRLLPMTTGPVLGQKSFRVREAVNNCISSVVRERRSSVTSTLSASSNSSSEEKEDLIDVEYVRSSSSEQIVNHLVNLQKKLPDSGHMSEKLISCESPTFANLSIPKSEIVDECSSGTQYVVYRIQYEAWFQQVTDAIEEKAEQQTTEASPKLSENIILQTCIVRRRFREFETLHSCLEDDPQLRPLLRGVKGPNKWSVLPFTKLDGDAIGERRLTLERYLQILISKEPLANSRHLREFLAYGSDASIAYVRKPASDLPRLDKFLMKTMTGMFDKLKTALPSLPLDPTVSEFNCDVDVTGGSGGGRGSNVGNGDGPAIQQKTSDRLLGFLNFNSPLINTNEDDSLQLRLSFDFSTEALNCGRNIEENLATFLVNYDVNFDKVDTAYDAADSDVWQHDFWNPQSGEDDVLSPSSDDYLKKQPREACLDQIDEKIPLASAVIDFSVETIVDDDDGILIDREPFVCFAKIIFGQIVERYLEQLVDDLTTEAMFTRYLHLVCESMWPNGVYASKSEVGLTDAQKEELYRLTLTTLKDYFPGLIVAIFGSHQYDRGMKLFLDSLQHPKLLRHLVYQLLDIFVDVLLVRSRSQSIMEKLSSSHGLSAS